MFEITSRHQAFLQEVERRACLYFCEHADPRTGLVRDRARMRGRENRRVSSIAATGFGLSALCIADRHGFLPCGEARQRALLALQFLNRSMPHERGFFYHFSDMRSGARVWRSEISSIDTTWLICGALHCRGHFDDPAIRQLATELYDRVDWRWMQGESGTFSHGWTPERGHLPYHWDTYSELMALYLLALGSANAPVPAETWDAWKRPVFDSGDAAYIDAGTPLFTHQYSHAWFDFRGRRDRHAEYFENSRAATLDHRRHCLELSDRFPWFDGQVWGVTSSDSQAGYRAWITAGCPADGTLVPCAAGGSLPFLPEECSAVLGGMLERYGDKAWGRYGFVDAFHPGADWYSPDVIGINLGITLVMAENALTGSVWEAFMAAPEAQRGMQAAGLVRT